MFSSVEFRRFTQVRKSTVLAFGLAVSALVLAAQSTIAAPGKSKFEQIAVARGGVLYDNWYDTVEQFPPAKTHPSYPATGNLKGGETWRCVSCHGWDYKGSNGAFASGANKAGVKGINEMAGVDTTVISEILRDKTHAYTKSMLTDKAIIKLAIFVNRGQIDMGKFIDPVSGRAKGSTLRGVQIYKAACQLCHGLNGRLINFNTPEKPQYIGTIARQNPWLTLHKIRNGQPGVSMTSLITMPDQALADVLTYTQSLPFK